MESIIEKLAQLRETEIYWNEYFRRPIETKNISSFEKEYKDYFEVEIDNEYTTFLKISDGLDGPNFKIYSSFDHLRYDVKSGIFENNELLYEECDKEKKYIFFADSFHHLCVFDKNLKKYLLLDRYSGDVLKEYESFNEMLLYIIQCNLFEFEDY